MAEFRMPSLGSDMEGGVLVEWLKKPGETLRRGDIVAVVETEKGAIEIEVFDEGVLDRYLAEPGAELAVGAPMAVILAPGETAAPPAPAPPPAQPEPRPAALATPVPPAVPTAAEAQRPVAPEAAAPGPAPVPARTLASPAARRLAAERGVDLAVLRGTGPGGAVQRADVEGASAPPPARRGVDLGPMRAVIAAAMARSKREIPHYYLADQVDAHAAVSFVTRQNLDRPPAARLLVGALFVKAAALAAKAFPEFSGVFENGAFHPSAAVHVGVAVSIRGGGLVAPAIHDTAELTLDELMAAMRDLIGRVRAGRFRSSEISDPTITVSSLGERGVEALWGVIYPPQVAIVGFGKVVDRPWAVGDALAVRPVVTATLAADHRVSDGHRGALFLARIGELLQSPEAL